MQVEAATNIKSCQWVPPNPHTIEFSDKKHSDMFKPFQYYDQVKLDEIGHTFQNEILSAVNEAAASASTNEDEVIDGNVEVSRENKIFLRRMDALVNQMPKWATRDEQSRMAKLDWMKVDLLYITDLQNIFSEYLQHYVAMLQRDPDEYLSAQDGGQDGP